jgi:hypothetical protein
MQFERITFMNDNRIYQIQVRGLVQESELNLKSPFHLVVESVSETHTFLNLCSDQSGLLGILRHLHGLGLDILSVNSIY